MTVYLCNCGNVRRKGERVCDACREEEKRTRRAGRELARKYSQHTACPVQLREWILANGERAFAAYAQWDRVKREGVEVLVKTACAAYGEEKQIQEGLPAVATPFFWFEGVGPGSDVVGALVSAIERLGRFDPSSAKIPAVAIDDPRLEEPAILLPGRSFWVIGNEWSE
jgi:hypothetical protein